MSLRKHVKKLHTQFVTCERCHSDYTFSNSDYTLYKTKDAILEAHGWFEFTDKSNPYLLCSDCTFSRKYQRLLFTIDNLSQTIITTPLKGVADDHNGDTCPCAICLALRRTTLVTNDFKHYLKTGKSFFYTQKPSWKSSFDDSYDFLSDPEIVNVVKPSISFLPKLASEQQDQAGTNPDTGLFIDFTSESPNSQISDKDSLVDQILLIDKPQDSGSLLAEICDNAHDLPIKFNQNIPAQTTPKHNFSISKRVTFSNGALPIKLSYASPPLPLPPGASNSSSIFRYSLPIIFSLLAIILVCFFRL